MEPDECLHNISLYMIWLKHLEAHSMYIMRSGEVKMACTPSYSVSCQMDLASSTASLCVGSLILELAGQIYQSQAIFVQGFFSKL